MTESIAGQHQGTCHASGSRVLFDTERRITDAGVNHVSSGLLPVGTVLMSSRAPVGYLAITGVPTAINQGLIAMVCDGPLPPTFVLNWAFSQMETIKARASGTTFPEISKKNFRSLMVVRPTDDVIAAYQQADEPSIRSAHGLCKGERSCSRDARLSSAATAERSDPRGGCRWLNPPQLSFRWSALAPRS